MMMVVVMVMMMMMMMLNPTCDLKLLGCSASVATFAEKLSFQSKLKYQSILSNFIN